MMISCPAFIFLFGFVAVHGVLSAEIVRHTQLRATSIGNSRRQESITTAPPSSVEPCSNNRLNWNDLDPCPSSSPSVSSPPTVSSIPTASMAPSPFSTQLAPVTPVETGYSPLLQYVALAGMVAVALAVTVAILRTKGGRKCCAYLVPVVLLIVFTFPWGLLCILVAAGAFGSGDSGGGAFFSQPDHPERRWDFTSSADPDPDPPSEVGTRVHTGFTNSLGQHTTYY